MKKINLKYIHIAIIIIGTIFVSIPIFHKNLWFDEGYTVGIVGKSFMDIWRIGSNDVHPILYYWILHIVNMIFGVNIYIYRIFSMLPIAILSIIGYTHIRKDFGEKVGIIFSFLVLFLPVNTVYSGEIRMYTWAMLIISLMSIYAYRIYQGTKKEQANKIRAKNWILFGVFSLVSCYTHYYGLATAGIMNFILFVYLIKSATNSHKKNNESKLYTRDLKYFTIIAIMQIVLYLPWFIAAVVMQIKAMSNGFWIPKPSIQTFIDIFAFQFTGNLDNHFVSQNFAVIFGLVITIYAIYGMIKTIKENKKQETNESYNAGIWAIGIYFIVMLAILIISLKKSILYPRYFLNLTGPFIFFLAYFIAKGGRKIVTILLSALIIAVSVTVNYNECKMNYDESNTKPLSYVEQNLQEGDMILFGNEASVGFVLSVELSNIQSCFYDKDRWNVEAAYEAFGENMQTIKTLEEIDNYKGRIWIVTGGSNAIYEEFTEKYGEQSIELIQKEEFNVKYHNYKYAITLIEKK